MRLTPVELLSNLSWVAVAASLWALWLARRRQTSRTSLLPGIGLQLTALAMLSTVLLPVISLTDDLQASHNPAEVERVCGRSDQHGLLANGTHPVPTAVPSIAACAPICMAHKTIF